MRAINWTLGLLEKDPRPKKWHIEATKPTWHHFERKINWFRPKKGAKKRALALVCKNLDPETPAKVGLSVLLRPKVRIFPQVRGLKQGWECLGQLVALPN
jgi:hypothetical protein